MFLHTTCILPKSHKDNTICPIGLNIPSQHPKNHIGLLTHNPSNPCKIFINKHLTQHPNPPAWSHLLLHLINPPIYYQQIIIPQILENSNQPKTAGIQQKCIGINFCRLSPSTTPTVNYNNNNPTYPPTKCTQARPELFLP